MKCRKIPTLQNSFAIDTKPFISNRHNAVTHNEINITLVISKYHIGLYDCTDLRLLA
jgi:hypothetical protein